jgi:hypothetical protein
MHGGTTPIVARENGKYTGRWPFALMICRGKAIGAKGPILEVHTIANPRK